MRSPLGPLSPGDRVTVLATAGPAPTDRVDRAIALLESWDLVVDVAESVRSGHQRARYLSADDAIRARDLTEAWCDPEVDGIFCIRGGYGTVRMLDLLDVDRMRSAAPKPVYGSSDVTGLHEWMREQLGAAGWFTPMIGTTDLLDDAVAVDQLRAAVFSPASSWTSAAAETLVPGTAEGTLLGGNLTLLAMTLGARTRPPLDNRGSIALIEDVTEEVYRIDSLLHPLLRSGWFDGVTGVALGSWKDCDPLPEIRALAEEFFAPLGIPVVWELGFGHGPAAHSIPLGVPGRLIADDHPRLELITPLA